MSGPDILRCAVILIAAVMLTASGYYRGWNEAIGSDEGPWPTLVGCLACTMLAAAVLR